MIIVGIPNSANEDAFIDMIRKITKSSSLKFSLVSSAEFLFLKNPVEGIRKYLKELEKNNFDVAIIRICADLISSGAYRVIKFNIIVYDTIWQNINEANKDYWLKYYKDITNQMTENDIVIANIDDPIIFELLKGSKMCVVSYGLSSKSSITASSIKDNGDNIIFTCCLQRTIHSIDKKKIELQEFPVRVKNSYENSVYLALSAVSTALVLNADVKILSSILI